MDTQGGLSLDVCSACHDLHNLSFVVLCWFVYTPFHHSIQMPSRNVLSDVAKYLPLFHFRLKGRSV